jgi:hypothetical protein
MAAGTCWGNVARAGARSVGSPSLLASTASQQTPVEMLGSRCQRIRVSDGSQGRLSAGDFELD